MPDLDERCPACFEPSQELPCPLCGFAGEYADADDDLPIGLGMAAGQYVIGKVLGRGNFGRTYLGWDAALATKVAIKEFLPHDLATRGYDRLTVISLGPHIDPVLQYARGRFRDEAQRLARFNHANIVRVRSYFDEYNTGYLVMDYYEGSTLEDELSNAPGPMAEAPSLTLIGQVLRGLQALHEPRDGADAVVHRDIKPANIYLARIGRHQVPILLDFGAARVAVGERARHLTTVFTPGYAPFEQQTKSGKQGPWTDVYACAATLYHMLTGVRPPSSLQRKEGTSLPSVRELNATISSRTADAVEKGMALDWSDRPKSAREFLSLLGVEAATPGSRTKVPGAVPKSVASRSDGVLDRILTHARAGKIRGISPATDAVGLRELLQQGWRFVQYEYCLSALVLTVRRRSVVFFVSPGESRAAPYTAVTALLGWWALPWGPEKTLASLRLNAAGGDDVTTRLLESPTLFFGP